MIVASNFKPDAGAYCKQIVIHGTSTSSADWDFSVKAYMMRLYSLGSYNDCTFSYTGKSLKFASKGVA
ncbi:hypothetical protein KY285_011750 [Solanum tuberosum]|nr:hypothetical protein KY284_010779 [Solanum tuberosum]KAH0736043.1 hypothetical protein KY285_011750 [Solanum tuberosum]